MAAVITAGERARDFITSAQANGWVLGSSEFAVELGKAFREAELQRERLRGDAPPPPRIDGKPGAPQRARRVRRVVTEQQRQWKRGML